MRETLLGALLLVLLSANPVAAEEAHPGVTNVSVRIQVDEGVTLAGVLTRPEGVERPPVIQFVQWLSCDTVMLSPERQNGWSQMQRAIIRDSGFAVLRVDKRGVGDSGGGDCAELDFDTELADHRAVLDALQGRDDVDTDRIVLFGASMGSRQAPLVAAGEDGIAGVLVWGGGALTWFERMILFDRHALELSGEEHAAVNARMKEHIRLHVRYLLEGTDPPDIIREDPAMGPVWERTFGTSEGAHYGRPFAFHQQAQRADWAAAWTRIDAPVLAVQGAFDWFENPEGGRTIERLAPNGRFVVLPNMDHHFTLYDSARQAFAGEGGRPDPEPFLELALPWLREQAISR